VKAITVRLLLTHTSGLVYNLFDKDLRDYQAKHGVSAAQQANRIGPVMPLEIHTAEEVDAEVDPPFLRRKT